MGCGSPHGSPLTSAALAKERLPGRARSRRRRASRRGGSRCRRRRRHFFAVGFASCEKANLDRSKGERQCPSPCTPTLPRRRRGLALPALRRLVLAAASGTPTALSAQTVEAAGAGSDHPIDGLRQKSLLVLLSALSAELLRRDPRPASVVLWSR